jgi:hypothetical protein
MTSADNIVEVDRAGLEQAELLGLAPGSPVLRVIGITRNQRDRPVEYSDVLYRPERFRFAIESRSSAPASQAQPPAVPVAALNGPGGSHGK